MIPGLPASAQNNAKRQIGAILENQFIKQTLEQQNQEENTLKAGGPSSNSYIRNLGATVSHQSQPSYPSMPTRPNEKVQYIQHGD